MILHQSHDNTLIGNIADKIHLIKSKYYILKVIANLEWHNIEPFIYVVLVIEPENGTWLTGTESLFWFSVIVSHETSP